MATTRCVARIVLFAETLQVCITDIGPKVFALGTATSNGTKSFDVRRWSRC